MHKGFGTRTALNNHRIGFQKGLKSVFHLHSPAPASGAGVRQVQVSVFGAATLNRGGRRKAQNSAPMIHQTPFHRAFGRFFRAIRDIVPVG